MSVFDLGAHARMKPNEALTVAARERWEHVIICGYQEGDEGLCVRSSHMKREQALWIAQHLVDYAKGL